MGNIADTFRRAHADYTYESKNYGFRELSWWRSFMLLVKAAMRVAPLQAPIAKHFKAAGLAFKFQGF